MKMVWIVSVLLAAASLLTGCVTTSGSMEYPAVGLEGVAVAGPAGQEAAPDKEAAPKPAAPSVAELLGQQVRLQLPAKILVADLGPSEQSLRTLVHARLEAGLRADPQLAGCELIFSELLGRRTPYGPRPTLEEVRQLAAQFQARYVLLVDYGFNYLQRVYWVPAAVVIGTLGLIPLPVGGEQAFCTAEFVLMDVPTTVFVVSSQGRGHMLKTSVWGWAFTTGGSRAIDETSLTEALDAGLAGFRAQLKTAADAAASHH